MYCESDSDYGNAKYCFIDCETTGFDAMRNQVLTLAAYVTDEDYNILGEHYGEFKPEGAREISWSEGAAEIHRISYEKAMEFPAIADANEQFISFLEAFDSPLIFIAHNMAYDKRMLRGTLSRTDMHFPFQRIFIDYQDTIKLLKGSGLISGKSKSLGKVCEEMGIEHNHHDAKSDAYVLIEIHKRATGYKPHDDEEETDSEELPLLSLEEFF